MPAAAAARVGPYDPRVRLAAVDLDGTFLASDGTVSARTIAAATAWTASGRDLVVVTGRPPRWVTWLGEHLGTRMTAICSNGALTYDLASGAVTPRSCLDPRAVGPAVTRLRAAMPGVLCALEYGTHVVVDPGFSGHESGGDQLVVMDVLAALAAPGADTAVIPKLIITAPDVAAVDLQVMVTPHLGSGFTTTFSSAHFVEVSTDQVDKAVALAAVCAERGITADEVVAFGDMPNDVVMLRWAGLGVAMGNAHPDAVTVADEVTASNDDDGVAVVLERLLG